MAVPNDILINEIKKLHNTICNVVNNKNNYSTSINSNNKFYENYRYL
jgi:hypothetical protein